MGELVAEFAGTMILILFGVGVVAQVVTGDGSLGDHDSIAWAWGLGVTFGVYIAARISGAHLNPAVTVALAAFPGFSWRKVLPYVAGADRRRLRRRADRPVELHRRDRHGRPRAHHQDPGRSSPPCPATARWTSAPARALLDQVVGTAILLFLILAVTDTRNDAPVAWMAPFIIGLIVVAIGMAWGTNAGYAINPARDFGPRLASFITGYGTAFEDQCGSLYFWVPIVGPLIGGLIGAGAYRLAIGRFLPDDDEPDEVGEVPTGEPHAHHARTASTRA